MFGASNTASGSGMFGNSQSAKPAGFQFGSGSTSNTANGASGTSFAFGANSTAKPASSGFGNTTGFGAASNTAGNTAFGNTTTGNTGNTGFGATNSGSTGFGATNSGNTGFGSTTTANTGFGNTGSGNTSSGLFGNTQPTNGTGSSLFGNNANQNTSTNGSLFGKPNTTSSFGNTSSGGGLFGQNNNNTTTQPASGGLFGQSNTSSTQAPSGGLFGASNSNAQPSTGGLFGSSAPKAPTGGLFGSTNSTQQPSGGLFGGSNSQQSQPATGGLFGSSTTQNNTSGGLLSKPAASSGGLFGSNNTQSTQSGGLFGNNANSTGSGLFGSTQNQNQNQNQLNGASSNQNPIIQTNSAQPSFGWSNTQQNTAENGTSSLHDKITASVQSAQNTTKYTPTINDQLAKLKDQWNPNSPKSALTSHVFNKFSEQEINYLLQQPRPQNESPEDWEKAMAARPSPYHYPVKVTSFTEVAQRVEVQLEQVAKSRVLLNNIHEKSIQLSSQRDLDTTTRMMKAKVRHNKLSKRLLNVATTLAVLKLKGYPLLPEEEEMSKQFQTLNAKLSDPSGPGGNLSDLFARLAILKERSEDLSSHLETSINKMNGGLSNITSDDPASSQDPTNQTDHIIQSLTKILYKQQVGLSYLNDVVQQDLAIVEKES